MPRTGILNREPYRLAKITLRGSAVTVEAGQLHYMFGQIQMTAEGLSPGGLAKSFLTKGKAVRPVYSGTGEIYLEPTFGELNILDIRPGEVWVLDKGSYVASDQGIVIDMQTNPAFCGMFGGDGWFQTQVSGQGKVIYWSPGVVERLEIQGQTLTVDGSFAVARTASLEYRVEMATKGLFKSWMSGEGLVSTFRGHGAVMLAPVPNLYTTVINEFGGLHAAIRSISRSS
ncbi:MAG TPA: AIM24 family protein [Bryobacteraceae bacterium]|nr:AIM24 family protein [Bryobacteraceae bacterium]